MAVHTCRVHGPLRAIGYYWQRSLVPEGDGQGVPVGRQCGDSWRGQITEPRRGQYLGKWAPPPDALGPWLEDHHWRSRAMRDLMPTRYITTPAWSIRKLSMPTKTAKPSQAIILTTCLPLPQGGSLSSGADLDLGFTLVELARTEQRLGVQDGADRCKRKARHVVETVLKLEKLLPSGQIKGSDSRASGGTRTHTVIFVSHIGSTNELETATRQNWQSIPHAQRDESLALPTRTFGHCAPLGLGSTGCGPLGTRCRRQNTDKYVSRRWIAPMRTARPCLSIPLGPAAERPPVDLRRPRA